MNTLAPADRLRIHAFLPRSRANGPGWRAVIWTQGCSIRCPGCFNPHTHDPAGGNTVAVSELFSQIMALGDSIEGITISGGEPFDQAQPLARLLAQVRTATSLSAILFTGHSYDTVMSLPQADRVLGCLDVLISGPYQPLHVSHRTVLLGSWKTLHVLTSRYSESDLTCLPDAEVIINSNASVDLTGFQVGASRNE